MFTMIVHEVYQKTKDKEWLKKVTKDKTKPDDIKKLHELFTRLSTD